MSSFPLSPLQESHWNLFHEEPHFPWGVSLTVAIHGTLEHEAMRAGLEYLVQRHEILRMRFARADADAPPRMEVRDQAPCRLEILDWRDRNLVERERECRRLEQALRTPLPSDGTAALAAALVRVGEQEHLLVLAQSALAADWRSLWGIAREWVAFLAGTVEREPAVQFADLSEWLWDTLESEDASMGFELWKRTNPRAGFELHLPLEHDRGERPFRPEELSRELPVGLQDGLQRLAEGRGLPTEALLCALWQAWLGRLGGLDSVVIGARSAGRAFQGLDQALGVFERALPVQVRLDERVSWVQLARQTDEQLACGAEWHEFYHPPRIDVPAGDFRYGFEHLPLEPAFEVDELRAEILRRDGHGEGFRGLLRVEETLGGSELRFAFDPRFLSEADAAAVLDPFIALLDSALARPEAPLVSLSVCSIEQRARVLELARGVELSPAIGEGTKGIHGWILEAAHMHPEELAVVVDGTELTYAELAQRSAALAAELQARGVTRGTLVGIHLGRSAEWIVSLLAVLRAGGAYLPLPPDYPRERILGMLADSKTAVVVGSSKSSSELEGFQGVLISAHAPRTTAVSPICTPVDSSAPAYVIYTSGSSGKPKGVPVTHGNLLHSTRARVAHYPGRVGRYLMLSSFAFDSSVAGIFWTLVEGGTLILPPEGFEKDLAALPALIARHRPTHMLGLPSLWSLVLEQASEGQLDSLETVIVAGESCPTELTSTHRARLARTRLYNEYGPTEGTVWSTVFDTQQLFERSQVPIGRPIPGTSCYVLTPERELAPIGVAGELWIAGPGVVAGYLDRPEMTSERFADDPFSGGRMYRTGDSARLLPDGNLEFLGRRDHQVKIRGYRIELEEIEAALAKHPAVREALVLARDDGAGDYLVAYVVPIGPRPAETDLRRYLGERLPDYMVPGRALFLEGWPQLPNGKIDRSALPAPEDSDTFIEPEGAVEIVLAALWADVLGLEQVGRNDDFFGLGGHSLSATRLYARLKETLQIRTPLRALFEHRTPASLAQELRRDPAERERIDRVAETILTLLDGEEEEEEHAMGA